MIGLIWQGIKDLGLKTLWNSLQYQLRQRRYRTETAAVALEDYRRPGTVIDMSRDGRTVTLQTVSGAYAITVLAPNLFRVRFRPDGDFAPPFSYAITKPDAVWPPCDFTVVTTDAAVTIRTQRLTCRVDRESGRLTFLDPHGNVISEEAEGIAFHPAGPVVCRRRIQPDEHFYGLGERAFGLDLRGRRYETWHTDPQTYQLEQDPIHLCIPVLVGLHSQGQQGYAILFDNTFRGHFDLGATEQDVASFEAEGGEMRYYFIYGPTLASILARYVELTGRTPLPPRWMLGYHQCRWSYYPDERVRKLAADFRHTYRVPCDAIYLDIHYMDGYRCFTWHPQRFPDPAGLIADLHTQGFKVVVIIDPGIKADHRYWVCQSGLENDVFCKLPDGRLLRGPVWPGDCYFPDFTHPRVRTWWGELYRSLVEIGVDGFWNDMNEPAVFGPLGTTFYDVTRHDLDGRSGDHREAHNVYGMQMVRATVEGLKRLRPDERPVCITRSGWAGVQRYALGWTGDNESKWDTLWLTMPMVMNLGLCGLAHTGPDIGGFNGVASGELFTRWLQMGVFFPLMRAHTNFHSPDQEPWSWGEPYLSINRRFIELRYRLLPYLYTAFWQCHQTGAPIVRPLMWAYQDDEATHTLDDQFLCGDNLLVAPLIAADADRRTVYLPAGTWYDFWSDEPIVGPAHISVEASLERIPVFVRAGAMIPMGPAMSYVDEQPVERLELHVYPAAGSGQALLYEDDGESNAFQEGEYRLTRFTLIATGISPTALEIRRATESHYTQACDSFEVVIHGVHHLPLEIVLDGETVAPSQWAVDSDGHSVRLSVGPFRCLRFVWTE